MKAQMPGISAAGTLARYFSLRFLIAMLASSIAKEAVLEHRPPTPLNLTFHLVLAAIAIAGIVLTSKKAQLLIAVVATIGFLSYVALLFARLA